MALDINAFDMAKAGQTDTVLDWARNMVIVSYGVVREVLDGVNVRVAYTVQESDSMEQTVDVSLLSLSSQLFQCNITPLVGDQVLILGLDAWSDKVLTGGTERVHGAKQGYNGQSCVGILMRTLQMGSAFMATFQGTAEAPSLSLVAAGGVDTTLYNDFALSFVSGDNAEHPINVDVLENRPYTLRMMSKQEKTIGADIKITIGHNNAGDSVAAAVDITLDEKSDITLTSKSGASVSFDKDFSLTIKGKVDLNIEGDVNIKTKGNVKIEADGNADIKAGGDVKVDAGGQCEIKSASGLTLASGDASLWQPNAVPTCPFGMPHGGASCGIVMLKGK